MLVVQVERTLCGFSIDHVIETMRPLPIAPAPDRAGLVRGSSIIRGGPVPVLDTAALFGRSAHAPARCVVLRVSERRAALLVDAVLGVRTIRADRIAGLPPLLDQATRAQLRAVDPALLTVLDAARLVTETAA